MKIAFCNQHQYWGSIGNDGGSRTVLLSAKVLRSLGHDVDIVANRDVHTWIKHPDILHKIPKDTDVAIAVSISAIAPMMMLAPGRAKLFYWMRGFEKWQMQSSDIYRILGKFQKRGGAVMCNSSWLCAKLAKHDIAAYLCFAGLDLDYWKDEGKNRKTVIGGLVNEKHKTKRTDLIRELEKIVSGAQAYLGRYDHEQLRDVYNNCRLWFAPTQLEGFHNVAAEANLCGCLVVCNRKSSNGMGDYATDETAMRYDEFGEVVQLIKDADFTKVPKMQARLREIGDRETNMEKMLQVLQ